MSASSSPITSPWRPSARSAAIRSSSACEPQLLEPGDLGRERRLGRRGRRRRAPSTARAPRRRTAPARPGSRSRRRASRRRRSNRAASSSSSVGMQDVAGRAALDALGAERLSEVRDVAVERPARRLGRLARPRPGRSGRPPGPARWRGRSGGRGPAVAWARRAGSGRLRPDGRDRAQHLETHPRTVRSGAAVGKVRPARKARPRSWRDPRGQARSGILVGRLEPLETAGLQATFKRLQSACRSRGRPCPHGHEDRIEAPGPGPGGRGARRRRRTRGTGTDPGDRRRHGPRVRRRCRASAPGPMGVRPVRACGAEVPPIDVHFHPDTSGCYGHLGSALGGRLDICVVIVSEIARTPCCTRWATHGSNENVSATVRDASWRCAG